MLLLYLCIYTPCIQNDDLILHPNDYEVPITSWLRRVEEEGDFDHPQLVDDWEICPDHIIMECFIGEGNFGEVYRGTLLPQRTAEEGEEEEEQVQQTHTVAIKVLRCEIQCITHTHMHVRVCTYTYACMCTYIYACMCTQDIRTCLGTPLVTRWPSGQCAE